MTIDLLYISTEQHANLHQSKGMWSSAVCFTSPRKDALIPQELGEMRVRISPCPVFLSMSTLRHGPPLKWFYGSFTSDGNLPIFGVDEDITRDGIFLLLKIDLINSTDYLLSII